MSRDPLIDRSYDSPNYDSYLSQRERAIEQLMRERDDKTKYTSQTNTPICDRIDSELAALTELQLDKLNEMEEFVSIQNELNDITNFQLMTLLKPLVERDSNGAKTLKRKLDFIQRVKKDLVEEVKSDLDVLGLMKENPNMTYEQIVELSKKQQ